MKIISVFLVILFMVGDASATELKAGDGAVNDSFGYSVSLSGTIGLVGAYTDDIVSNLDQGSAYVFRGSDTATGTVTQNVKLTASDGAATDYFGLSVSLSGTIGLVGAMGDDIVSNSNQGSAYVFHALDNATGAVTQNVKLIASDGAASDYFGYSVSLSGSIGLVGAYGDSIVSNSIQGSAYVFRALDTATGTVNQNVKLTASDGAASDYFGSSVSLSGTIGLVGAYLDDIVSTSNQGSAYVFRALDTATGTVTENVKLTASDGAASDYFGFSVSLSGTIGLVGALSDDISSNSNQGSAYVFRALDTATGTVTQNVKLTASDGAANDQFGSSVSLDGDNFLVGAQLGDGVVVNSGKTYNGSVSSLTTLDAGNTSKSIDGISFVSQEDWIIGNTSDYNAVTLTSGDNASVIATGKAVYIGKSAGSDGNTLTIQGSLTANAITVGGIGGKLQVDGTVTTSGGITVKTGAILGGNGSISGGIILQSGSTISPGNSPGILSTGNQTWNGGGKYLWEVNNSTGTAGMDWDLIRLNGGLSIGATSADKFILDLSGSLSGLTDLALYDWTILTSTSGFGGTFAADKFLLDTTHFTSRAGRC